MKPNPKHTQFVVYHKASTMEKKRFGRAYDARRFAEKLGPDYAWTDPHTYETQVVHMVTRKNLMTGLEYQEKSNTPLCCSPASETYWSM